ncbi:MAG: hypothetical protein QF673_02000 [Candidatus Hydrothermarchaeota archaeon]|jgi:hypothetical protein|nr:hypothetical protein [Candidatus Hydrothermarchaeota archaeon]
MLPEDFLEYSRRFEFGFLVTLREGFLVIDFVDFEISRESIAIKNGGFNEGKACLVFANERYSENSFMAQVIGDLVRDEENYKLIPYKVFWTYPFSLDSYPTEIVRRWRRK